MAVPPQRIRIKRRREEEPVETLYIHSNSARHSKRRFTDFVFQRVVHGQDGTILAGSASPGPKSPSQPQVRETVGGPSVPLVRATKPGEEFEEARRAQGPTKNIRDGRRSISAGETRTTGLNTDGMRRFHLESLAADDDAPDYTPSKSLHKFGGGVQKRKVIKPSRRFIVVEKKETTETTPGGITTATSTRAAHALDDLTSMIGNITVNNNLITGAQEEARSISASTPRKRRIINEAERRWKEERAHRSTNRAPDDFDKVDNKKGASVQDDPTTWDQDSEQLADELAEIAMQMTGDYPATPPAKPATMEPSPLPAIPQGPKPTLKYQPRPPKHPRRRPSEAANAAAKFDSGSAPVHEDAMELDEALGQSAPQKTDMRPSSSGTDGEYVFDEFIRRPLGEIEAAARMGNANDGWNGAEIPRHVGVIYVTEEDIHQWAEMFGDDEEECDDDEDSNAEDYAANDYPDEDLDFDDEYDDVNAAYQKFRFNASDDEEFDFNDYNEHGYQGDYDDDSDGM